MGLRSQKRIPSRIHRGPTTLNPKPLNPLTLNPKPGQHNMKGFKVWGLGLVGLGTRTPFSTPKGYITLGTVDICPSFLAETNASKQ